MNYIPLKPKHAKPPSCVGCSLEKPGQGFVPYSGAGFKRILAVAESPGEQEVYKGEPLIGPAGQHFDRVCKRAKLERSYFWFHNTIQCRPPDNELLGTLYQFSAVDHCRPNLDETIERLQPKVILALGAIALNRLTGFNEIGRYRGYTLDGPNGIPVIATYHPSFLLPRKKQMSSAKLTGVVIWDLLRAVEIAEQGYRREPTEYLIDPPPESCAPFLFEIINRADYIAWDTETAGKGKVAEDELKREQWDDRLVRASYAYRPRHALTIPWTPEYMGTHRAILGSRIPKVGWNDRGFDTPIVRRERVELNGIQYDGMEAWHVLQPSLRKKLEFVASFYASHLLPWKHLYHSDFKLYSAIDADATICSWLGIIASLQKSRTAPEMQRAA